MDFEDPAGDMPGMPEMPGTGEQPCQKRTMGAGKGSGRRPEQISRKAKLSATAVGQDGIQEEDSDDSDARPPPSLCETTCVGLKSHSLPVSLFEI